MGVVVASPPSKFLTSRIGLSFFRAGQLGQWMHTFITAVLKIGVILNLIQDLLDSYFCVLVDRTNAC